MTTYRTTSPLAALSISAARPAQHVAACALAVSLDQGDGQAKTRLIPAGSFDAPRGSMSGQGPWQLDAAGAGRLIQRAASRATDIAIDYEHQTLLADRNGQPAPAAGWVDPRSLEWRDDGLYGAVSWTERASGMIAGGEYRYLSPVFPYDADTGAVLDLLHLALTNTPAIDEGIPRLAAARMAPTPTATPQEDDAVTHEQLIKHLGLTADATDAQIETALAALKAQADQVAALRQALDLKEDDKPEVAIAALKAKAEAAEPDMSQYVPKAVFEETTAQLAALKASGDTAELDGLIEKGLKDGRIPGQATADWLKGQGLAACKAHLAGAPAIAALKGTQTQGRQPEGDAAKPRQLSEAELAVCKAMGLTTEQYHQANPVE